jgi:hypothetical protein
VHCKMAQDRCKLACGMERCKMVLERCKLVWELVHCKMELGHCKMVPERCKMVLGRCKPVWGLVRCRSVYTSELDRRGRRMREPELYKSKMELVPCKLGLCMTVPDLDHNWGTCCMIVQTLICTRRRKSFHIHLQLRNHHLRSRHLRGWA